MAILRGMTWDHARGYDPLAACARLWQQRTGVTVEWFRRSLQDFESYPVEELARRYDLIVIDHPHVGQITREQCLLPLDRPDRADALATLAHQSIGPSGESYRWEGHLWALPIDAATQIQAWRRDRLTAPARSWNEVMVLARNDKVLCPMRPPHSLMALYTLTANLGRPCAVAGNPTLIDPAVGVAAYDLIADLMSCLDPACYDLDPIAVYERMAMVESEIDCVPLIYGYVSYGLAGFRPARIAFADIPVAGDDGSKGSALGGTGIAVSHHSDQPEAALDFAFWVASAEVQRGLFATAGGQPGNAAAWDDPALDALAGGFYSATRATLEGAWVRPRHDGYMGFQDSASRRLNAGFQGHEPAPGVIADLNRMYNESIARPAL